MIPGADGRGMSIIESTLVSSDIISKSFLKSSSVDDPVISIGFFTIANYRDL